MPETVYLPGRGGLSGFRLSGSVKRTGGGPERGSYHGSRASSSDDEVIARFQTLHQKARTSPSKNFEGFSKLMHDQSTGEDEETSQSQRARTIPSKGFERFSKLRRDQSRGVGEEASQSQMSR